MGLPFQMGSSCSVAPGLDGRFSLEAPKPRPGPGSAPKHLPKPRIPGSLEASTVGVVVHTNISQDRNLNIDRVYLYIYI